MPFTAMLLLAAAAWAAEADPVELGRRSMAAHAANGPKVLQYAYREYRVDREITAAGLETNRRTQTWEIIGLEGSQYRRLMMRNDKPLSAKEQRAEDQRQEKEAALRRKETPEQRRRRLFSFSYSYGIPYDRLTEVFDLRLNGEKEAAGRKTWVLEATPKADFKPANDNDRETLNYKFVLWLDEDDYLPVWIDAEVTGDHSKLQKGSTFRMEFMRLADGTWSLEKLTVHFAARLMKFITVRGEAVSTYSDYHKFQTESSVQYTGK